MKNKLQFALFLLPFLSLAAGFAVDDSPRQPGEWGFRPLPDATIKVTPPGFCWRPQKSATEYEVQASRTNDFAEIAYAAKGMKMNVHCPPEPFPTGTWFWRFRFCRKDGWSDWSKTRRFEIAEQNNQLPLPAKTDLLARIPQQHPRLFVRPEQIPELRKRAQTDLKPQFDNLVKAAENYLKNPPPTTEPPKYPKGTKRGSDPWRKIWWGNRVYIRKALGGAAELAFAWQLGGREEYGQMARKVLLDCAKWDPKGASGYRYNDEAGMPYNYYFSRTYTFVNALMTEEERQICRDLMQIRGQEMYRHLHPRHLWRPYASHSNRAWHFLGEIGIAFHGEIPEAGEWVWFAANVFANVYPVWNDEDGGWHEGTAYWSSYISRFTWWADIMNSAMGINAFDKPYFAKVGQYPLYTAPPGTRSGGFGDCTTNRNSSSNASLVAVLAAQANNPYWQWYAEAHKRTGFGSGYVGFMRSSLPKVQPKAPTDLPSSKLFQGIGLAELNTNLLDAGKNVQIHFKSSPFGTQSHGYNAQNSFLLYVAGERIFLRSGKRDSYGSQHHRNWMWHTKSDNCITVNGESQGQRTAKAIGEITHFETTPDFDYVVGEAGTAYAGKLKRFTRRILFIKPEAIVVWDSLEAPEPAAFEWRLHTANPMVINGQKDIRAQKGNGACKVEFLYPANLQISQTDKYDTPPRPRIKLVEHHLTAIPATKTAATDFVTVLRPYFSNQTISGESRLQRLASGYNLTIPTGDGRVATVLLNTTGEGEMTGGGLQTNAEITVVEKDGNQKTTRQFVYQGAK